MVKFVDMAWVADKSLDVYAERHCIDNGGIQKPLTANAKSVSGSVKGIFGDVFDLAVSEYSKKYDFVLICIPCFPITRMNRISIMTRFICKNTDVLSDNGISASQFQEAFEKFINLKCKNEYITQITDNTYVLNGRGVLLEDWKKSVIEKFGSSLVDCNKDFPFDNNPNFIENFEFGDGKFTDISAEDKFKIDTIIGNLTNN